MQNRSFSITKVIALDLLELLAAIFRGPDLSPGQASCPGMLTEGLFALAEEASELPVAMQKPLSDLAELIEKASDPVAFCQQLESEYVRLFIAAKGGIVAPLYQSCYSGNAVNKTLVMGEPALAMQRRLDVAGLSSESSGNEPADHISTELEYLYFLLHQSWQDDFVPQSGQEFVRVEMLPWVERFSSHLATEADGSYFSHAARFLLELLRVLSR